MKLIDLLARELESWPEDSVAVVQDCCGVIPKNAYGVNQLENLDYDSSGSSWLLGYGVYCNSPIELSEVASDHSTAIITRAQWQSARDKLKRESAMPKANKDGWIRHMGGKCPVDNGTEIEVKYREGSTKEVSAGDWYSNYWRHDGSDRDIMAYRIHAPEQADPKPDLRFLVDDTETAEPIQAEYADSQMPAAKYFDGPLQWRDRIHTIDFDKAAAQQAHDAAMAALDSERAELVAKLKSEGLALIREPIKAEDSAQGDMGDWRNWRVGDLVEVIKETEHSEVKKGTVMPIESIDEDDRDQHIWIGAYCPHISALKWHSRP